MRAATMYRRQESLLLQVRRLHAALKSVADRIAPPFVWWMEGLWIGLPENLRSALFQHRDRLIIRIQGNGATIERYTENRSQPMASVTLPVRFDERCAKDVDPHSPKEIGEQMPKDAGEHTLDALDALDERASKSVLRGTLLAREDAEVTVILPSGSALTKRLPLPLSAEPELRSVLFHELDRLTPVPIEQFAFDYHILQRDREAGELCVELALVRRASLDESIAVARRLGVEPSAITVADSSGTALALNLLPGRRRRRLPAVRPPFRPATAGGALLMLLLALYLPLGRYENLLDEQEGRVRAQREQAVAARAALADGEKSRARAEYLSQRRRQYVAPIDVLLALTQEIPDHTWLSRLSIGVDRVQLQGETTQASAVLEIVESIDQLQDAHFESPVARSNVAGKEQFSIVASLAESEE